MADIEAIRAKYPAYAFLLNDPEIGPLLTEAVDLGMDTQTFQAKLMATNWWKQNNQAQRQWYALTNTDPAQGNTIRTERGAQVRQAVSSAGLFFSEDALANLTEMSLTLGVDVASPTFRQWLGETAIRDSRTTGNITDRLKGIAQHDYLVPIDGDTLNMWAAQIASGTTTEEAFKATLGRLAKGRFGAYGDLIDQGLTPGQIFAPYKSMIANELELGSADQVDLLNDPRWSKVTGTVGADGKLRPMTLSETQTLARSQEAWKQTSKGKALGASLTQSLLKTFGEM